MLVKPHSAPVVGSMVADLAHAPRRTMLPRNNTFVNCPFRILKCFLGSLGLKTGFVFCGWHTVTKTTFRVMFILRHKNRPFGLIQHMLLFLLFVKCALSHYVSCVHKHNTNQSLGGDTSSSDVLWQQSGIHN